jgi:hypothetical protein
MHPGIINSTLDAKKEAARWAASVACARLRQGVT